MMFKNTYSKWEELEKEVVKEGRNSVAEIYLSQKSHNRLYFGVDNKQIKHIYIEFNIDVLDSYNAPDLVGMKISKGKVAYIDRDKKFLIISNGMDTDDIFQAFASSLAEGIKNSPGDKETIEKLEETIKKYKNYFANCAEPLSDIQEQGLCGELLYLDEMVKTFGQGVVNNWLGPDKNKRDFVFDNFAAEIKTTLNQSETIIIVSNENQLDNSNTEKLILVVYTLEKNPNGKVNVEALIKSVSENLTDIELYKIFVGKLIKAGVDPKTYKARNSYTVQSIKKFNVNNEFPCITKKNLPGAIYNVEYKLNLSTLRKYLIED